MSTRRKAISFRWAWTWARSGRWLRSSEIGPSSGKKTLEDFGIKVGLGRILVRPDRHRKGVVRIVKLCFNRGNLVLLHEEKIGVHFGRQVVLLVISHAPEIIEYPRQRIRELINIVISLHINVRLSLGGAAKIIQPNAISERAGQQDRGYKIDNPFIY